MTSGLFTCRRCGFIEPTSSHYGSRVCRDLTFVANMKRCGCVHITPKWAKCFKKVGIPVWLGPVSTSRNGSWTPKAFVEAFVQNRLNTSFKARPLMDQVVDTLFETTVLEQ